MRMAGCEAADEEEDVEEYLVFRTGASGSGMTESGTGESGMGTDVRDVCARLGCDPKDAGSGIEAAGIPCVRCERRKVRTRGLRFRADSVKKKMADLAICTMIRVPNITENGRNRVYSLLGLQRADADR